MSDRSVMLVGGPMDGHRIVWEQHAQGNTYRIPVVDTFDTWWFHNRQHENPEKMTVRVGEYRLGQVGSYASREPLWVAVYDGER